MNPIKFGQKMLGLTPSWSENIRINTGFETSIMKSSPGYIKKSMKYMYVAIKKIYIYGKTGCGCQPKGYNVSCK